MCFAIKNSWECYDNYHYGPADGPVPLLFINLESNLGYSNFLHIAKSIFCRCSNHCFRWDHAFYYCTHHISLDCIFVDVNAMLMPKTCWQLLPESWNLYSFLLLPLSLSYDTHMCVYRGWGDSVSVDVSMCVFICVVWCVCVCVCMCVCVCARAHMSDCVYVCVYLDIHKVCIESA